MAKKTLNFVDSQQNSGKKAANFTKFGWSVIPLFGDFRPDKPKAPALRSWKQYQTRLPETRELAEWFTDYDAMAIVLGQVSKLVVLDIDDASRAVDFERQCPDLVETFTVRSGNRQLPHYYFTLPDDLTAPSCNGDGVELRSDGQYIVAPGTVMGGRTWEVVDNRLPKKLTEADLSRILAFLYPSTPDKAQNAGNPISDAISTQVDTNVESPTITASGLRRFYRDRALKAGRNNALFGASCYARDRGWSEADVIQALTAVHVDQPAPAGHQRETRQQREREAYRTIASAFTQPARPVTHRDTGQLPNSVRETLLQYKLDQVARILDGLLMAGIKAGEHLMVSQVYAKLAKFGIGKNAIYEVLKSASFPPPPKTANAVDSYTEEAQQCLFGRVTKPGKNRGRPILVYIMPSIAQLCQWLGVKNTGGDYLQPDDLRSPAMYRRALHSALIRRAPGKYPRAWLSERLGVSSETCRRYERSAGICVQPTFFSWELTWRTLERIIPPETGDGEFIQDENGKRYPPLVSLAKKLLAVGLRVFFRKQDANHYHVPESVADGNNVATEPSKPDRPKTRNVADGNNVKNTQPTTSETLKVQSVADGNNVATEPSKPDRPKTRNVADGNNVKTRRHTIVKTVVNAETGDTEIVVTISTLAEKLYQFLRSLNPQRSLTRKNARTLVETYGENLVERGMEMLRNNQEIYNPAGFLWAWLKRQQKPDKSRKETKSSNRKPRAPRAPRKRTARSRRRG